MSSVICNPDECQQTLLYERNGDTLTPFIRMICVDANGNVSAIKDFNLDGSDRVVTGEVIANPGDGSSCCHSVTLYDYMSACVNFPFIRQYQQGEDGSFSFTDYDPDGQSFVPSGIVKEKPPVRTSSKEKMCDASNRETFYRWFVMCGSEVADSYDTDLNGVEYTASDAVYSGDCACKPLTLRRRLCDATGDDIGPPVEFWRTSEYNGAGDEISTVDTTISGDNYTVQGTVHVCRSSRPETVTVQKLMCDRAGDLSTVPLNTFSYTSSPFGIMLSNGVTMSSNRGGWTSYYFEIISTLSPRVLTFSEPVDVEFGFSSLLVGEQNVVIGNSVEPDWIDDRVVEWDAVSHVVRFRPSNHADISFPPAERGDPSIPMPANIIFKGMDVTQINFNNLIPLSPDVPLAGITYMRVNKIMFQAQFMRTSTYNSWGQLISTVDTDLNGDPYPVQGTVIEGQCPP